jgi:hypothetical protein
MSGCLPAILSHQTGIDCKRFICFGINRARVGGSYKIAARDAKKGRHGDRAAACVLPSSAKHLMALRGESHGNYTQGLEGERLLCSKT